MRFLSLLQPWASLMAIGAKTIETRSWRTDYHGLLGIHAATSRKGLEWCKHPTFLRTFRRAGIQGPLDLPFGAILAVGALMDCILIQHPPLGDEAAFGNYEPGRWGWRFKNLQRLPSPIPWRGRLGLWADEKLEALVTQALKDAEARR